MANVLICKNPFRPQLERETIAVRAGTRLDTMLRNQSLVSGRASRLARNEVFVVQVNGDYLLQSQWARRIKNEDTVVVMLLPGGGGGSNPLRMVLQVALIVAAVYTGGLVAAAWGATAGALASAGVMLVGGIILNALMPPPKANAMQAREQASPTYTIGAQGNTARLMEAIPVLYGRHLTYPDFASQPYTEIDSNQVYLYQLFCISQGEVDIEQIRIEDTPIGNFAEVTYQIVNPGERVTLFPDNVITSSAVQGIELKGVNEAGGGYVGPFVANTSGSKANQIAVDMAFPQGMFYANDEGGLDSVTITFTIEAQPIDNDGVPSGVWVTLGNETFSAATATPQMRTYRYNVAEGRYQVRAQRTNVKQLDSRYANTLQWGSMRAYLPSQASYGNVTMLAVAMRATNNLNQSTSRRINVIATRKLKRWNPVDGWSTVATATRNPAWAFADVLSNTEYGKGMRDSRVNLHEIYRLASVWETRGDTFDGVFDTTVTLWEALTRIARVGRAMPMYYAGVIDVVRNEPRTIKKAMFTPMNIVADTFSIDYKFVEHDSPDHIIVEIVNEDTWQPDEVKCVLPGGTENRPYRLQLPGCVNRAQAWREGISMAAANRDQRRFVGLTTELEGHIPKYSDLVGITHDVPKWGLSGFVRGYNATTRVLTTSEPLEWWPSENHYIALRARDGSVNGPYRVTRGADDYSAVFTAALSAYISTGDTEEPTYYQFGPGERRALDAQVLQATPDESGKVALSFVNYADSVHTAEHGGNVPPPAPPSLLPMTPNSPVVDEVTVYATAIAGEQMASCTPARGATVYEFQASNDLGATWTVLGSSVDPSLRIRLPVGPWWVRARGIGAMPGPWKIWQGLISATMLPPPMLSQFYAEPQIFGIKLTWAWPSAISLRSIEIYYSETDNFSQAIPLGRFAFPHTTHTLMGLSAGKVFYFWARVRDVADQPGPWYPGEHGVYGQSSADAEGYLEYFNGLIGTDQLAQGVIQEIADLAGEGIAEGIFNDIFGPLAGEDDEFAGEDVIFAGTKTVISNVADADLALSQRIDAQVAKINSNTAAIQVESTTRATQNEAMAQQVTTVAAQTAANQAAVQQTTTALASLDGALEATYTLRAEATVDGKMYAAGMGLGVYAQPGEVPQSSFYVLADRFALLNLTNGIATTPFVVQGGQTFISQALIGTAWIQTAHIADASIINAKIVDLAVTNAKIANAAITSAKIGDAQIKTAHIDDLSVNTLKISNNAVTVHGSASADVAQYFANGGRTITVSMSFGATADVTILVTAVAKANVNIRHEIIVDGGVVWTQDTGNGGWWGSSPDFPGMYWAMRVTVGAGAHTFQLRQTVNAYNTGAKFVPPITIVCLGAMR